MMFGFPGEMFGVQIIEDSSMADRIQVRFPRSKKKRIRKKWRRQSENWTWKPWSTIYQVGNHTLLMHPSLAAELRRELETVELTRHPWGRPAGYDTGNTCGE